MRDAIRGGERVALDAVRASGAPHAFLSVSKQGVAGIVETTGNRDCHVILPAEKVRPPSPLVGPLVYPGGPLTRGGPSYISSTRLRRSDRHFRRSSCQLASWSAAPPTPSSPTRRPRS